MILNVLCNHLVHKQEKHYDDHELAFLRELDGLHNLHHVLRDSLQREYLDALMYVRYVLLKLDQTFHVYVDRSLDDHHRFAQSLL